MTQRRIPFVILTITRSGSTWLLSLLNGQDGMVAYEEIFLKQSHDKKEAHRWLMEGSPDRFHDIKKYYLPIPVYRIYRYLRHVRDYSNPVPAYGLKIMLNSQNLIIISIFLLCRFRLICLIRDNLFEGAISRLLIDRTALAHGEQALDPQTLWEIPPADVIREMKKRRLGNRMLRMIAWLWPWPAAVIEYEKLKTAQGDTLNTILAMLGQKPEAKPVDSRLAQRIQHPHANVIKNQDQVIQAVCDAGLGWYVQRK